MRIKTGEYIKEVDIVVVRKTDIIVNNDFYATGNDTAKIGNQLLTQGYADLTNYKTLLD